MRSGALLLVLAAAGCGAAPAPDPAIARVEGILKAAEDLGASADGTAAVYLSLARQDLDAAAQYHEHGDAAEQKRWLARARIDIEVAELAAREVGVRSAVERTLGEVKSLEETLHQLAGAR